MTTPTRRYSLLDQCLINLDQGIRTVFNHPKAQRANPSKNAPDSALSHNEQKQSIRLMRVNHAGEISAQALYQAQALTARSPKIQASMQQAAEEENDHLAWCQNRLDEMGGHISYLSPVWYLGSFAIGTIMGLAGDKWSLGFLAETEQQVVEHLDTHLHRLPLNDHKSRKIIEQMRIDESEHATMAIQTGATTLPLPIKHAMRFCSKIMTKTAYWV